MNLFDFLKSLNQLKIKTPEDPINVSFLLQISQREGFKTLKENFKKQSL